MNPINFEELISKYRAGTLSAAERKQLFQWYNRQSEHSIAVDDADMHRRLERIEANIFETNHTKVTRNIQWGYWAAAAAVVMLIGTIPFMLSKPKDVQEETIIVNVDTTQSAELITSDNKYIALGSLQEKDTVRTDNLLIYKTEDGFVSYHYVGPMEQEQVMHQVKTPLGSDLKIQLADGTKVWLNAASELSFPIFYKGGNRVVHLKGEAYFDVMPIKVAQTKTNFSVHTDRQIVQVLGTQFNIKSFEEDVFTETSLYEGSIRLQTLSSNNEVDKSIVLQPGQQSVFDKHNNQLDFKNIRTENSQSWRDGYFSFKGENLKQLTQHLARWYPVEFKIDADLAPGSYFGDIPKTYSLNEVLHILIQNDMNYSIVNKDDKIIVNIVKK